ncbi:MAG TPA: MOSC domain-containing protein [Verrucomicrobiae bacterium]|nr:MOSC domain-containing protein [Verrucomicrobiae bacterium]
MKLLSINVAMLRPISHRGNEVMTGIYKQPVKGSVKAGRLGLAGDAQADLENHGGIYKAVYSYPFEHYSDWSRELGRNDFALGQFGENLTVTGLSEDNVRIGDVFRIGTALLEVTQPRVPCFKLAHKMGLPEFPKKFIASGRTGFYHRVLEEGEMSAGDAIERIKTDPNGVSAREMMRIMHIDRDDVAAMEKAVGIPALTPSWREELEERLRGGSRRK